MKKLSIAICDIDEVYAENLAINLSAINNKIIAVYLRIENIKDLYINENPPDILVLHESYLNLNTYNRDDLITLLLSESNNEKLMTRKDDRLSLERIFKYSMLDEIESQILLSFSERAKGSFSIRHNEGDAIVIGFLSGAGGVGTTSIASAISKALALTKKKVLYLNLENIPTNLFYFEKDSGRNISDFIYYLLYSKRENVFDGMEAYTVRDEYGAEALRFEPGRNQLCELENEELREFLIKLKSLSDYDYVCVDLNIGIIQKNESIFDTLDKVILLNDNDICSIEKNRALENIFANKKNKFTDTIKVTNRFCGEADEEEAHLTIEDDPTAFTNHDNKRKITIKGDFGRDILRLIEYLEVE